MKSAGDILSLPSGDGALNGLSEEFSRDLQTSTVTFSIQLAPAPCASLTITHRGMAAPP